MPPLWLSYGWSTLSIVRGENGSVRSGFDVEVLYSRMIVSPDAVRVVDVELPVRLERRVEREAQQALLAAARVTRCEMSRSGVGRTTPFLRTRIVPPCSTMNVRSVPSRALVMKTGPGRGRTRRRQRDVVGGERAAPPAPSVVGAGRGAAAAGAGNSVTSSAAPARATRRRPAAAGTGRDIRHSLGRTTAAVGVERILPGPVRLSTRRGQPIVRASAADVSSGDDERHDGPGLHQPALGRPEHDGAAARGAGQGARAGVRRRVPPSRRRASCTRSTSMPRAASTTASSSSSTGSGSSSTASTRRRTTRTSSTSSTRC